MKRSLRADEIRLWAAVVSTVRPARGRTVPEIAEPKPPEPKSPEPGPEAAPTAASPGKGRQSSPQLPRVAPRPQPKPVPPPAAIEPLRKRRLVRERDPIGARLDLHGLDQDRARVVLQGFLREAHLRGHRAVLVITGKGSLGDGVLRRRVPDWLSEPPIRSLVAGFSSADRRHGGAGALYVALKRAPT